jgi:hypothetical protein
LIGIYTVVVWAAREAFDYLVSDATYLSHLLAALAVAFSVVPAHGWMQTISHRLFASANLLDVDEVIVSASQMFQEVSTEENLMEKFSSEVSLLVINELLKNVLLDLMLIDLKILLSISILDLIVVLKL